MDAFWLVVVISNLPFLLTRSRGEYLRVVQILEMVEYIEGYISSLLPLSKLYQRSLIKYFLKLQIIPSGYIQTLI